MEKVDSPLVTDIAAAAALATIELVGHPNAAVDGPWHAPIERWQGAGRIRKIVRRARGAAWERAQRPSGVTVHVRSAQVRAYLPSPTDDIPPEVAALQIRSSELPEPPTVASLAGVYDSLGDNVGDGVGDDAGRGPVLVVAISPHVELSWGKAAAQAAHAAQILWRDATADELATWNAASRPLVVVHANPELWRELLAAGAAEVHDGGYTEVAPGTLTACSLWYSGP